MSTRTYVRPRTPFSAWLFLFLALGSGLPAIALPLVCVEWLNDAVEPYWTPERRHVSGVVGYFRVNRDALGTTDLRVYLGIGGDATVIQPNRTIDPCQFCQDSGPGGDYILGADVDPIDGRLSVVIPANEPGVLVSVDPAEDNLCETTINGPETVALWVLDDPSYTRNSCLQRPFRNFVLDPDFGNWLDEPTLRIGESAHFDNTGAPVRWVRDFSVWAA